MIFQFTDLMCLLKHLRELSTFLKILEFFWVLCKLKLNRKYPIVNLKKLRYYYHLISSIKLEHYLPNLAHLQRFECIHNNLYFLQSL